MFTKAQIAKLAVEDQELLAEMVLSKTRRREKLLGLARGRDWRSRYFSVYIFAFFLLLVAFYRFNFLQSHEHPVVLYIPAGATFVSALIFHITRVNRRLDALLKLLEMDHKLQDDAGVSKDEAAG